MTTTTNTAAAINSIPRNSEISYDAHGAIIMTTDRLALIEIGQPGCRGYIACPRDPRTGGLYHLRSGFLCAQFREDAVKEFMEKDAAVAGSIEWKAVA